MHVYYNLMHRNSLAYMYSILLYIQAKGPYYVSCSYQFLLALNIDQLRLQPVLQDKTLVKH